MVLGSSPADFFAVCLVQFENPMKDVLAMRLAT
jgi:hypothetical protein